jgi:hypothetical protein
MRFVTSPFPKNLPIINPIKIRTGNNTDVAAFLSMININFNITKIVIEK